MPEPIYIVSGFPRSGTSMMMRAIDAGGIPAVYDNSQDASLNDKHYIPNYVPNPNGFYEIPLHELDWKVCAGKVVKVTHDNLRFIPEVADIQVVYMKRDPREIRTSYLGLMNFPADADTFRFLDDYEGRVASDCAKLRARSKRVTVLNYCDVVCDPTAAFAALLNAGWPIQIDRTVAMIDPRLYRNRVA